MFKQLVTIAIMSAIIFIVLVATADILMALINVLVVQ